MDKQMIREKLHQLINELEDREALEKLYADALEFKYSLMEEEPLTEEEWDEIDAGLAQIRNDEPCTHQAAMQKFWEWQHRK
jgi:predicted transcriptional regulator